MWGWRTVDHLDTLSLTCYITLPVNTTNTITSKAIDLPSPYMARPCNWLCVWENYRPILSTMPYITHAIMTSCHHDLPHSYLTLKEKKNTLLLTLFHCWNAEIWIFPGNVFVQHQYRSYILSPILELLFVSERTGTEKHSDNEEKWDLCHILWREWSGN